MTTLCKDSGEVLKFYNLQLLRILLKDKQLNW